VIRSRLRGSFERLRLLVSIGARRQPRLEQARLKLDRVLLSFARADPILDPLALPPVVVAAVGGSGTRALVQVLRRAGWFMGNRVDSRNEDSLPMAWFLTKWLRNLKDFPDVDSHTLAAARRDFERMLNIHRRGIPSPDTLWGWKNPRSMWLLPFLAERFPKMRFIHMIRDARDMMLSENRYFLRQHGHWILGPDWWRNPLAAQLELWRMGNKRAIAFGQQYLGDRYHMLRYEDLCQKPAETVTRLLEFLKAPEMNVEPLIEGIRDRGNIGRWREAGAKVMELNRNVRADLEQFGYKV
jgi:sulfotransferase family protein